MTQILKTSSTTEIVKNVHLKNANQLLQLILTLKVYLHYHLLSKTSIYIFITFAILRVPSFFEHEPYELKYNAH